MTKTDREKHIESAAGLLLAARLRMHAHALIGGYPPNKMVYDLTKIGAPALETPIRLLREVAKWDQHGPLVSMTLFCDFLTATGTARIAAARKIADEDNPFMDFYREVREEAIARLRSDEVIPDSFLAGQEDERRRRIYPLVARGLNSVLRRAVWADRQWVDPPTGSISQPVDSAMGVHLNPEVGFRVGPLDIAMKMYFRGEPLSAQRRRIVLGMLMHGLPDSWTPALIDAQRGEIWIAEDGTGRDDLAALSRKLLPGTKTKLCKVDGEQTALLVRAELRSLATIMDHARKITNKTNGRPEQ